jgi:hypothetical protein
VSSNTLSILYNDEVKAQIPSLAAIGGNVYYKAASLVIISNNYRESTIMVMLPQARIILLTLRIHLIFLRSQFTLLLILTWILLLQPRHSLDPILQVRLVMHLIS